MNQIVFDGKLIGPWVCAGAGGVYTPGNHAIGISVNGEIKAGIYYDAFTGSSICMHSRCDDRTAPNRMFYWIIFDYPFNQLKVKRVTGLVSSANLVAQHVNEKLGWVRETVIKDYFPDGDGIVYEMRREGCRWLRLGEKYEKLFKKAA